MAERSSGQPCDELDKIANEALCKIEEIRKLGVSDHSSQIIQTSNMILKQYPAESALLEYLFYEPLI